MNVEVINNDEYFHILFNHLYLARLSLFLNKYFSFLCFKLLSDVRGDVVCLTSHSFELVLDSSIYGFGSDSDS